MVIKNTLNSTFQIPIQKVDTFFKLILNFHKIFFDFHKCIVLTCNIFYLLALCENFFLPEKYVHFIA